MRLGLQDEPDALLLGRSWKYFQLQEVCSSQAAKPKEGDEGVDEKSMLHQGRCMGKQKNLCRDLAQSRAYTP